MPRISLVSLLTLLGLPVQVRITTPHSYVPALKSQLPTAGRTVPLAATRIYQMSFFMGFSVSALIYWFLNTMFPALGASKKFEEINISEIPIGSVQDSHLGGESNDEDAKDGRVTGAVYAARQSINNVTTRSYHAKYLM